MKERDYSMAKETSTRTTFLKAVAAIVVAAASFGVIQIGEYSINPSSDSSADGDLNCTPGTYTASAAGMDSDVTVTATFDESSITDLSVDVSGETPGIGAEIGDEMTQKFLEAQGSAVDGVSEATVTSNALKSALDDCIAQATGEGSVKTAESEEESETSGDNLLMEAVSRETEAETQGEAIAEEAEETQTKAAGEESEEEAQTDAAATDTQNAAEETDTGRTYTAAVEGAQGEIQIAVTFAGDQMVGISYDLSGETPDIGAVIGPEMSYRILEAQSTDVDGVSEATVTSDAFKAGVQECIEEAAKENPSLSTADLMTGPGPVVSGSETGETVYVPGTYTAKAQGKGEITVSVLFDENKILSISYDLSSEEKDIGTELSSAILDSQSTNVDDILEDTTASEALKQAVEDCIEQAKA